MQRVRRDRAFEHLQRRAGVLGARLAVGVAQRAHDLGFEARRRLQHRGNVAGLETPCRLLQRLRRGAGRGGAVGQRAGKGDAAAEQRPAMQQAVAGNLFERRRGISALGFAHGLLPVIGVLLRRFIAASLSGPSPAAHGATFRHGCEQGTCEFIVAGVQFKAARASFDHLVGEREQRRRHGEAERIGGLELMTNSNLVGCCTGRSAGLSPLRTRST